MTNVATTRRSYEAFARRDMPGVVADMHVLSTGRVVLEGKAGDLLQNEDLRKAYLGR